MRRREELQALTGRVIGGAMEVHTVMGPGMPEGVYHESLEIEFDLRGIPFESNPALPAQYKGRRLKRTYHPDFIIDGRVVLEIKAVETVNAAHCAQVVAYLHMTKCLVGLLLNFHAPHLREGIHRFVGEKGLFEEGPP